MALMSGKVYSNTGAPSNADGVDGDIYLRLDGMKTTYRKESGAWVAIGSTLGAIPEIISGVGAPSNALGADEQYYRDTSNQNIYYKQGSMWNLVGNLAGATFALLLDQAGIGKNLGTAPNRIDSGSLNAVTTVGEYYYTNAVTDTPTPYGLMKVWRENSIAIYQLVQASGNAGKLYNRYTTDGGATWGPWVEYANVGGNAGQRFKVAAAVDPDDAVRLEQMSGADILFGPNHSVFTGPANSFSVPAKKTIRVILIGGGGGGGAGGMTYQGNNYGDAGEDGQPTLIYPTGNSSAFYVKANGGLGGGEASGGNGSAYALGSSPDGREVEINKLYDVVILSYQKGLQGNFDANSPVINHPTVKNLSLTASGQGKAGTHDGYYAIGGGGSGGSFVEALIMNRVNTPLNLTIDCGAGGAGGVGLNQDNVPINGEAGNNGVCVIFY